MRRWLKSCWASLSSTRAIFGLVTMCLAVFSFLPGRAFADDGGASAGGAPSEGLNDFIDGLWVLIAAALVFFMQAGFLAFEIGCVRPKNTVVTALKNVADWVIVSFVFFIIGFGLMFGTTSQGVIGIDNFMGPIIRDHRPFHDMSFFLFQLAFCGTAATIVSGAMAERTGFKAYLTFVIVMGAIIYPVFGHWVWGNAFITTNEPWLAKLGYVDFAGSSVVHGIGAWASLAGIKVVGPRIGRFTKTGKANPLESNSLAWSALGVLILWFGWWGFNGGSTLALNADVPAIIANTNIAAAAAGLAAFIHAQYFQGKREVEAKFLGGVLGGLVAITACCHVVTSSGAILVGAVAGVVHNVTYEYLRDKLFLDDVVGAIPVHGFCGAWGVMAVGLLGQSEKLANGRLAQIGVQALGCVTCFVWAFGVSYLVFLALKSTIGIRVLPMREIKGLTLSAVEDDDDDDDEVASSASQEAVAQSDAG